MHVIYDSCHMLLPNRNRRKQLPLGAWGSSVRCLSLLLPPSRLKQHTRCREVSTTLPLLNGLIGPEWSGTEANIQLTSGLEQLLGSNACKPPCVLSWPGCLAAADE